MSLNIPDDPAPNGYYERPADYSKALEDAKALLEQLDASSEWEDAGERDGVRLSKIVDKADAYAIPVTRGEAVVEQATPSQVLATLQLPGMRKKWDQRLESGYPIRRFSQTSYQIYSVMKSPSYFIWPRDVCAVQEVYPDGAGGYTLIQVSVPDEERLPDAGSYAKSRTRATVELSGWRLKVKGEEDVELSYTVKVHLNGSIPTSIVQMLATETPMCVGRVRDVFYTTGHAPYELTPYSSQGKVASPSASVNVTQTLDDGDGSEANAGERRWTALWRGTGADEIRIAYDAKRMYPSGVAASASDEAADAVQVRVDEAAAVVVASVSAAAEGKRFGVVLTPRE